MNFIGIHFHCSLEAREILIAELSQFSFDTFEEHEQGFSAYCEESDYNKSDVLAIATRYRKSFKITFEEEVIPRENWNQKWEENFDPVFIGNQIVVRATFHSKYNVPYEIVIHPKMSFGTGHHATTHLMLSQQLKLNHNGKIVYDFGSGTGILAIMASKLGAIGLLATDVDDWCIENSKENFELNNVKTKILQGRVSELELSELADIILANINKNVLIAEMTNYAALLKKDGHLLLSGFYVSDIPELVFEAGKFHLSLTEHNERDNWAVLVFKKGTL